MDISSWLAHKAVWSPQKIAIRFKDREINYALFERRVAHLAGYLADKLDIQAGDRVGYLGLNSPELLDLFFACARLGAIFVPLNSRMTAEQIGILLRNCEPRCMFVEPSFGPAAAEIQRSCDGLGIVFFVEPDSVGVDGVNVDRLIESGRRVAPDREKTPATPVLIAYTSGTTGTPKGAVFTHDAITFSAINSNTAFNMRAADRVLTFLPMFHVGGLMIQTVPAFHVGATVTIHERFDPAESLREIERQGITLMIPPPAFSKALTSHPMWSDTDLSSIRGVAIGSTNVPPEIMQPWFDRDVPVEQLYGLTEGAPAFATSWEYVGRKARSIGCPLLYCQAHVVDEHMQPRPIGEPGEIMLRGRNLFSEYWRNAEATQAAFTDGWFHTGDVGFTDSDGYFYIVDRIKNIVIVGSSNVYPTDLERVLSGSDAIAEAAVVGRADPETGEALVACVVLKDGHTMTADEVRGLFRGRLAEYQHPKHVVFLRELPHTSLGKVQKSELRQLIEVGLAGL